MHATPRENQRAGEDWGWHCVINILSSGAKNVSIFCSFCSLCLPFGPDLHFLCRPLNEKPSKLTCSPSSEAEQSLLWKFTAQPSPPPRPIPKLLGNQCLSPGFWKFKGTVSNQLQSHSTLCCKDTLEKNFLEFLSHSYQSYETSQPLPDRRNMVRSKTWLWSQQAICPTRVLFWQSSVLSEVEG